MRHHPRDISNIRWFTAFGLYILALCAIFLWARSAGRTPLQHLVSFVIFVSFACQFCPLPIIPMFLWISREYNPFLVALLGSMATCIANLHDYYILNSLLRFEKVAKTKETRWFRRAAQWFERAPFWTLTLANFLPLPVDVPRLLAISNGYSRIPFSLATFVGRYPRYLILAVLGYELKLPNWAIIAILLLTLLIALIKTFPKLRARWRDEKGGLPPGKCPVECRENKGEQ